MVYDQKDLLKFALDLYQKTKEAGLVNNWHKDGLDSILDAIKKINPNDLLPSITGGEIKNQREPLQRNPQEEETHLFWKQEGGPSQNGASRPGQSKARNVSPISIYETVRDVNIQAILPGITSHDDLHLFISQDTIELYGTKAAPGGGNNVDNFHKTIRLPAMVEPSGAKATYRNGILSISFSKKKPDPPMRIIVKFE